MRLRELMAIGAVLLAGQGCGDSLGPPHDAVNDLVFSVAPARGVPSTTSRFRTWHRQPTPAELGMLPPGARGGANLTIMQGDSAPEDAPGTDDGTIPWIWAADLFLYWTGNELTAVSGLHAWGNGYEMTSTISAFDAAGTNILPPRSRTQAENLYVNGYSKMLPYMAQTEVVPSPCGAVGHAHTKFTVFARFVGRSARAEQYREARETQEPCPRPAENGGGGVVTTEERDSSGFQVCYYEVWVDSTGAVVDVVFLGCERIGGGQNVE